MEAKDAHTDAASFGPPLCTPGFGFVDPSSMCMHPSFDEAWLEPTPINPFGDFVFCAHAGGTAAGIFFPSLVPAAKCLGT